MPTTALPTLLDAPERHPLRPPEAARALGRTAVVAPHPDDESLGCGGLLALLAEAGVPSLVVVASDGAASHPGSRTHPPARLARVRRAETHDAVAALCGAPRAGAAPRAIETVFLALPDGRVPHPGDDRFEAAADRLAGALAAFRPETVVVPWRRDPHPDHRAVWALADARRAPGVRALEYPVWAWTASPSAPRPDEAAAWRLDVSRVLARKAHAVAAHRSQTTALVADAPDGFRLAPHVLALFARPWELYLDPL